MTRQLAEMQGSSAQTKQLIYLYRKQLEQLTNQTDRTQTLADRMKDQADRTKTIADQAVIQANAARSAAETAASQLELSQRPWVSAKFKPMNRLWIDEEGLHVTVEMDAKNIGQSPAVRVEYKFAIISFFAFPPSSSNPYIKREEICNTAESRSRVESNAKFQQTWFPGNADPVAATITLPRRDFDTIKMAPPEKDRHAQWIYPTVIVCIAYRPYFKDIEYHTGYILDLHQTSHGQIVPIPNEHFEVPATDLYLAESFGAGADAN